MRVPTWTGVFAILLCAAQPIEAQPLDRVEVTAFGGYRLGGDLYEIAAGRPVDTDGAASFGVAVNIPFTRESQIEALVTHQQTHITLWGADPTQRPQLLVTVDHYQVGGLTEFSDGRTRPFLTGLLGLTRFEAGGDHEVRLSASAGGGVKMFPSPRVGLRLDGRVFATLVDADVDALVCGPGVCVGSIDTWLVWQAEFTAGVVIRF
jgi:hypothetical protein